MVNNQDFPFLIWILSITCLLSGSLEFKPIDNYLIDCGSSTNKSVGVRTFVSDDFYSNLLTTQKSIPVNSISSLKDSVLFETAIVFDGPSHYTFPIQKHGRHLIRLYFFPFLAENFNLSKAKFSVSAQNFTLIKEYRPESSPVVKEFFLNITSDKLVLTFSPHSNSFAYVNALEFFSLPDELIPVEASFVASQGHKQALWKQALETVARVNMGNLTVNRNLDALWRLWIGDGGYLVHHNLGTFLENVTAVNSTSGTTEIFAPSWVYGTATKLYSEDDPGTIANITWNFPVDPGFEYLVRLHFCDILPASVPLLFFNVYVNSLLVSHLNLLNLTSNVLGAPYFLDVIARVKESTLLNVSVGTSSALDPYSNAILNGLEIMKINNSKGSLDVLDSVISRRDALKVSKLKIAVIVGLAVGLFMAKVADFGLSKMGPEIDQTHVSTAVKGSFGYLDPEYLTRQQLTDKSDVYSFGVVMFEILCGRPVIDPSLPREKVNLVEWAMKCQKTGRVTEIIDPCLVGEVKPESLNKYVEIAEKCLAECGIDRPTMGDVLWNMEYALQLQGTPAERSNHKEEEAVLLSHVSQFSSSISTTSSSVRDLAGASLSKVFAQMVVREEMR
ncbi:probable receptor-like protein kinase At2g39360 [Carica papaya]|uniref:probable receptor-like protein kinase At2g39360 n=1 Tax=Carica papaya TaxID=3649 RepID=UPI000B8D05AB|nr:probable receptor-like protein kinase At2g39360 [Carica papaya]